MQASDAVFAGRANWAVIAALCVGTAVILPAFGQAARSSGDNARAAQQMQQLAAEHTALLADNAKLKDEVAELKNKLDQAAAAGTAAATRAKQSDAAVARASESGKQTAEALEKSRTQMQELITRFRATALDLKTVETDRNTLRSEHESLVRDYRTCVERNVGLYQVGREALERLGQRGFFSKVGESEPFTQIARARLENLIDDYRSRLDESRVEQSKKNVADKSQ
jgi:signal transduction histidine kinase